MKYVITGGAGNISKPLAEQLLAAGQQVKVIGRSEAHLKPLIDKGADAAIGSVEDVEFLKKAFAGAEAVYTMEPPNFQSNDVKKFIINIGKNYAEAIKESGSIKHIVNLSSIGADQPSGAGPISALHGVEALLNAIPGMNVKHIRAGFFFNNLLFNVDLAKNMNIIGNNFGANDDKLALVDTHDIAEAAFEELLNHTFTGHSVRYVTSDERTTPEIAKVIGEAIGKPDLTWVSFPDDQALAGMLQSGLSEDLARNYVEMGSGIRSGMVLQDYWKHRPQTLGKSKLEDFAKIFAAVYNSSN